MTILRLLVLGALSAFFASASPNTWNLVGASARVLYIRWVNPLADPYDRVITSDIRHHPLTGSFEVDEATSSISNVNVTLVRDGPYSSITYYGTARCCYVDGAPLTSLRLVDTDSYSQYGANFLELQFEGPLSIEAGTVAITRVFPATCLSMDCDVLGPRFGDPPEFSFYYSFLGAYGSGSVTAETTSAVPEPATWIAVPAALALLALRARKH